MAFIYAISTNLVDIDFSTFSLNLASIFESSENDIQRVTANFICRSSLPEVFCKKRVLRNFTKFTGKHLRQSVLLRHATLLKKTLWYRCFPVSYVKFLRTPFLQNTSGGCFCSRSLFSINAKLIITVQKMRVFFIKFFFSKWHQI